MLPAVPPSSMRRHVIAGGEQEAEGEGGEQAGAALRHDDAPEVCAGVAPRSRAASIVATATFRRDA